VPYRTSVTIDLEESVLDCAHLSAVLATLRWKAFPDLGTNTRRTAQHANVRLDNAIMQRKT
jgi:hypothetical protein